MASIRTALLILAILANWGAMLANAAPPDEATYSTHVKPVLQQFCGDCHTTTPGQKRWAFDSYPNHQARLADQAMWSKVEQLLSQHIMPPINEAAPSPGQRRQVLQWIDEAVFYVDPQRPDPGPAIPRRLNRAEYANSVRDVLGVETDVAAQFPADDSGYGFDNIADVLSLSPLHLEKYLTAASDLAAEATRLDAPLRVGVELAGDKLLAVAGVPERAGGAVRLAVADEVGLELSISETSMYRLDFRAKTLVDGQALRLVTLCDNHPLGEIAVGAPGGQPNKPWASASQTLLVKLEQGRRRLTFRAAGGAPGAAPQISLSLVGVSGPFAPLPPQKSEFLRWNLGARPLGQPVLTLSGEDFLAGKGRSGSDTGRIWLASTGFRRVPILLADAGRYRVRMKVGAQQAGSERVRLELRVGDHTLGPFDVTAEAQGEQWIETEAELSAGEQDCQIWFLNEFKDPQSGAERWLWLHEISFERPGDEPQLARQDVVAMLGQAGRRLFRRPLTTAELARLGQMVDAVEPSERKSLVAVRAGLVALLTSPKFLFHLRPKPAGVPTHGVAPIDEFALASRLSYFLWSSVPDDELLALAARQELRNSLPAQVRRMLRDPRSAALTANFAGQWLQLRDLEHIAPDKAAFPEFNAQLAGDMRRETELVFEHILRENRPVAEFLNADYTFINARLAAHYGLPSPPQPGFQRVSWGDLPRRGVLTHGSILTITSLPTRTSPVKRGKWLLEQILGTPPPPAPRDVPPLPENAENEALALRTRLEQHRNHAACASCHAVLDPLGFALENFDATGRWRTQDGGHSVDASGQLVTGEKFANWRELQTVLIRERQSQFVHHLTERLLTYALGRGVTYRDKLALREIVSTTTPSQHAFQDLVLGVCQSPPFQQMRVPQAVPVSAPEPQRNHESN